MKFIFELRLYMKVRSVQPGKFFKCGFTAQLGERRTGIAQVTSSNPVEALIFFRLLPSNCLNWNIYNVYIIIVQVSALPGLREG